MSVLPPLACCNGGISYFICKVPCYFTSVHRCQRDFLLQDLGWGLNPKHKQENITAIGMVEGSGLPSLACWDGAMSQFYYEVPCHYTFANWCQGHFTRKCLKKGCNSKHRSCKTTMLKIIDNSTLLPLIYCNGGMS